MRHRPHLRRSEFLLHRDRIRVFVCDVDTHRLREIIVEGEGWEGGCV